MWDLDVELITEWIISLDKKSQQQVIAALELLQEHGPTLGRPLVDSVTASRHKNMKELRPGSSGRTELRLFAFDPKRRAIMLIGGDKSNQWNRWYRKNIPIADKLYDQYLEKQKG
ncbi:type II toxin-antitoxin system RelE/ParE family toxin [Arcanobacterium bovis]|uniref:Diaminopimelate decarboxylase n=1 Tax=Arcanobacterium bovis TaxID=2529275 RepID=A0A4Q9UZ97_9ACTO|nr:type II toxin-antitoxin system RelE/ParE family toxin [Arcanobacterium bovis]TBW21078.1 diaminopimelate decarboxylase [Arcanobacterium bovis]